MQRYERGLALPIHRPSGKSYGAVITTSAELDAWVVVSSTRKVFLAPESNADFPAVLNAFRRNISDLRRLREQSVESRLALAGSRYALRQTLDSLAASIEFVQCKLDRKDISVSKTCAAGVGKAVA